MLINLMYHDPFAMILTTHMVVACTLAIISFLSLPPNHFPTKLVDFKWPLKNDFTDPLKKSSLTSNNV